MVSTIYRLKSKLRLHKKETASWDLDEDSMRLKQTEDISIRSDRSMTFNANVTDDVDEIFYNRERSKTSPSPNIPQYRTTEQLRSNHHTPLSALHEDVEVTSNGSTSVSTTPPNNVVVSTLQKNTSPGMSITQNTATGRQDLGLERLRADVLEVKEEVKIIRREVINEFHVIRYDVLKELFLLKSAITQLSAMQSSTLAMPLKRSMSEPLSTADQAVLTRQTSTKTSPATRDRLATSRTNVHKMPPSQARASVRLTQLAPVAENALSTPLTAEQINDMFPLIDCTSEFAAHARSLTPGTRSWALTRVEEWLDVNVDNDTLLAVVGDGGTGKSAFCGIVVQKFHDNLLAAHCCQFDRKSKSSPRNVLLSVVHQLVDNLPSFKNHLARLNLKYVLEEADPILLAAKVLVDPLNAVEEPKQASFILVDGIDQCATGLYGQNELLDFFAQIIPQIPLWVRIMVSSKPSSKLAECFPVSSVLDFSATNDAFVADVSSLVDDIACNFSDNDVEEAKKVLKQKGAGNFAYLNFTKQALSHPGLAVVSKEGAVPLDVLHELPETLYDIYAEIFEDKFGQGRDRVWDKAKPLLQLMIGATGGPYSPVTEEQAKAHFQLTAEDLRMLRRSFVDLVAVRNGAYRIESSALCAWLSDPARSEEQFYFNIDDALQALRKMRRAGAGVVSLGRSESDSVLESSIMSSCVTISRRSPQRSLKHHEPPTISEFKPVGILKRGKA
ncbi:unnamed protein product [Peronospora belbahrii]|uniref:Nephrocystin 3-like N-terminal domain-containing protein n=1 Tax=Peronospora belbahrii TaxID=622444 RepID=A0ABN8D3Z7_9STRA|nr:unnamed protein product [Peronospora belbahrii]